MNRRVWFAITAVLGVLLVITLIGSQLTVHTVGGGIEGTRILQEGLRTACLAVAEEEPPLRVLSVPPSEEWKGWRWKVEATLRAGKAPGSPDVDRAVDRIVSRALTSFMQGKPPAGLLLVLHVPGQPDWNRVWDGQGRPVESPAAPPRPGAPR